MQTAASAYTSRATAMTIETINSCFDKLESVLKVIGLADLPQDVLEQHIWNCDETGFCTAQASKKVIAKRGERDVHDTMGGSGREFFTVLAAGCASGVRLHRILCTKEKTFGVDGCRVDQLAASIQYPIVVGWKGLISGNGLKSCSCQQ